MGLRIKTKKQDVQETVVQEGKKKTNRRPALEVVRKKMKEKKRHPVGGKGL